MLNVKLTVWNSNDFFGLDYQDEKFSFDDLNNGWNLAVLFYFKILDVVCDDYHTYKELNDNFDAVNASFSYIEKMEDDLVVEQEKRHLIDNAKYSLYPQL